MSAVTEHLAQAICALPETEKIEVINTLLGDDALRKAAASFLIDKLFEPRGNQQVTHSISSDVKANSRGKGKKERGRKLRESYISDLQQSGIQIYQAGGQWAKTANNLWVAIPTATIEWRTGRWFLGLSEDKLIERIRDGGVVVVLLCLTQSGSRLDFVIPSQIVKDIAPKLSKSKGEVKFNIKEVDHRYYLVLPEINPLDISSYMGNISILRK